MAARSPTPAGATIEHDPSSGNRNPDLPTLALTALFPAFHGKKFTARRTNAIVIDTVSKRIVCRLTREVGHG